MNMKKIVRLLFVLVAVLAGVSCARSTEKYAQKEHGKKFGSWELNYNAGDYDVYWPSLVLSEKVQGDVFEIVTDRNWWTGKILSRDTTSNGALLNAKIISVKSKNDARYYNSIRFYVSNMDNMYRPRMEHRFVFNEGKTDSLSFSKKANDSDAFIPEREVSEQIIQLLSGKKPVAVKVEYGDSDLEGTFSFVIDGCPKLKQGLELNQERKVIANKEFSKADSKVEKALMNLFE